VRRIHICKGEADIRMLTSALWNRNITNAFLYYRICNNIRTRVVDYRQTYTPEYIGGRGGISEKMAKENTPG
jgi:hypothetical protein